MLNVTAEVIYLYSEFKFNLSSTILTINIASLYELLSYFFHNLKELQTLKEK